MSLARSNSKLVTPPDLAVALETAKTYLRVDGTAEDTLITSMLKAATSRLETLADRKFKTQTWDIYYDNFVSDAKDVWFDGVKDMAISEVYSQRAYLELPFGPIVSIANFYTYDDAQTEFAFDSSNYNLDTISSPARVTLRIGAVWPQTVLRTSNGIKLNGCVFGSDTVPDDIQQAILILTAYYYENRGDAEGQNKLPNAALNLIEPYRRIKVGV